MEQIQLALYFDISRNLYNLHIFPRFSSFLFLYFLFKEIIIMKSYKIQFDKYIKRTKITQNLLISDEKIGL